MCVFPHLWRRGAALTTDGTVGGVASCSVRACCLCDEDEDTESWLERLALLEWLSYTRVRVSTRNQQVETSITVDGMHCDGCVETIEDALGQLAGISKLDVRLGAVIATFEESEVSNTAIIGAIRNAGDFEIKGFTTAP